ncbi:uncharacterized protein BX664DRAFT_382649 [Halteromyces radiatus]|uniref:uncharacterized protein n=1 Tax=Halteromyces radiatus TaxID=101107 RepID=UPI00221FB3D8|nr:uncharacterized protein BX664DRAFT_382649 [Halteromyces radiatus]KAI8096158.1 hypothetical protein BX664DRAFT_382649 [Halteromyces radiatus]
MSLPLVRQVTTGKKALLLSFGHTTNTNILVSSHYRSVSPLWSRTKLSLTRSISSSPVISAIAQPSTDLSSDGKHIILPNPSQPAFKKAARVLPSGISEQFAILNACIQSGSMDRAERVMKELYRTRPEEMKVFVDTRMYNTFLNGFVEGAKPQAHECLAWFDRMVSYGITPDANTYAILVKGFLNISSYHTARMLLQDMRTNTNIQMKSVVESDFLSTSEVASFKKVISEGQSSTQSDVQELLQELEIAANDVLGKESSTLAPETASFPSNTTTSSSQIIYENIPEAKPTDAIGVKFLQEQLSALQNSKEALKMEPFELQLALEKQGYEVALQRLMYMREASKERGDTLNALHLTPLKKIMWDWHEKVIPLIREEIQKCEDVKARDVERRAYGPFLKLLPAEKLSIITILELLRLHNSSGVADGMKTARAVIDVGKAVETEYNATHVKRISNKGHVANMAANGKSVNLAVKKAYMQQQEQLQQQAAISMIDGSSSSLPEALEADDGLWNPVWPSSIRAKVGSVLTSLLIDSARIPVPSHNPETGEKIIEQIPAFFHTYQYVRGKRVGIIKFSDQLTKLVSKEPLRDTLHPRLLPMLVHPRPWLRYNDGGYLSAKSVCMRIKDSPEQMIYLYKASENSKIDNVLKGLDVLGSTKWRVNKNVFDVVLEAWNSGEAIADIPPSITEPLPLPEKPIDYDTDPKAKFNWVTRVKEIQSMEKNYHSLRCDVNYKVETARAFLNLPMYFPHNMDFRGRAYPIPPTLNHLGNDLCRGLLCFDEAKPLGERGWRWLRIHMANLYGYDKHSFTERENFTMENLDNIFDSVDNPMTGKKWWLQAENPWQCLSACFEVAAAVRSGNPIEFKSRLPVHQDGTCNGLQHYAALGGDKAGAQAVNLAPGDRPADVYTGVAEMVNKLVEKEAKEGNEDAQMLVGKISRKVVKQTVMTNVYGVTFIGARAQIENRLKERDDIPPERVYSLAGYLAKKVFSSLGEMFNGARNIQDWLTDSARRIAKSVPKETLQETGVLPFDSKEQEEQFKQRLEKEKVKARRSSRKTTKTFSARNPSANQMTSVIWTTPLGLPIVQPYRRTGKKQVTTLLQTVFIEDPDASRPVNALKQSTAFPPNFIHSLDATHMLMSAVACFEKGLTFASVHDSYWTHACDVDAMNVVIRDQFIELHTQPIMENLINEFKERYKDYRVPNVQELDKDGNPVTTSKTKIKRSAATISSSSSSLDSPVTMEPSSPISAENEALFGLAEEPLEDGKEEEDDDDELNEDQEIEKKKASGRKYRYTWDNLTFAPLPAKGEFDINEVKDSDYFFH